MATSRSSSALILLVAPAAAAGGRARSHAARRARRGEILRVRVRAGRAWRGGAPERDDAGRADLAHALIDSVLALASFDVPHLDCPGVLSRRRPPKQKNATALELRRRGGATAGAATCTRPSSSRRADRGALRTVLSRARKPRFRACDVGPACCANARRPAVQSQDRRRRREQRAARARRRRGRRVVVRAAAAAAACPSSSNASAAAETFRAAHPTERRAHLAARPTPSLLQPPHRRPAATAMRRRQRGPAIGDRRRARRASADARRAAHRSAAVGGMLHAHPRARLAHDPSRRARAARTAAAARAAAAEGTAPDVAGPRRAKGVCVQGCRNGAAGFKLETTRSHIRDDPPADASVGDGRRGGERASPRRGGPCARRSWRIARRPRGRRRARFVLDQAPRRGRRGPGGRRRRRS